jgi:PTS system galactitol-specific IIA component
MDLRDHVITVALGKDVKSSEDAIRILADELYQRGYVKDAFKDAVLARERSFPTGIPTEIPVALPHADAEYSELPAIALGVLAEPVSFGLMGGDDDETVETRLIFMISLPEPKDQMLMIQRLVKLFREKDCLVGLHNTESATQAESLLQDCLLCKCDE